MSTGRYSQRGFAFQGFAFRTWGLAGGNTETNPAIVTTRLALVGTSMKRMAVEGTSMERMATLGTSQKRLTIEGSSR